MLNCNGITNKLAEIKYILKKKKPDICCLSETKLTGKKTLPKFEDYNAEYRCRINQQGGGIAMIIKKEILYTQLDLNYYNKGLLEIQGIKVKLKNSQILAMINFYNPKNTITDDELEYYLKQVGNKFIMTGDLNAHSLILDDTCVRNGAGRALESILSRQNVCLVNPRNYYTYIDRRTGKKSCLDVCLVSPNLIIETTMMRGEECGSDHVPIAINVTLEPVKQLLGTLPKWIYDDANWSEWQKVIEVPEYAMPNDVETLNKLLTGIIIKANNSQFKRSLGKVTVHKNTVWWNKHCKVAIDERRRAFRMLEKHPTRKNLENYQQKITLANKQIAESKKASWEKFIGSLNMDVPLKEVWRKINSIKGKATQFDYPLTDGGVMLDTQEEKASLLKEHYKEKPKPISIITEIEMNKLINGKSKDDHNLHDLNNDITMNEIEETLNNLKNTSPGKDEIHNICLKHLPDKVKELVFNLYNVSFVTGELPQAWKLGTIIPIAKPGKSKNDKSSYRPITLLSAIGKSMEKILLRRVEWYIEKKNHLSREQCRFRKGMSTMDVIMRLENKIRDALQNNENCIVVYLDLKAAFDKVSHRGVLYKLAKLGIQGKMLRWYSNYFKNRKYVVRINKSHSDEENSSVGVPQGAISSPLMFNVFLHDMPTSEHISGYSYADDLTFAISGTDVGDITSKMQMYIDEVSEWLTGWGMELSTSKTYMQQFYNRKKSLSTLRLNGTLINAQKVHKLLGLYLDSPKLTWNKHIEHLVQDSRKRIDILKVISSYNWGASRKLLRMFYIAYIRSKLDYGSHIYNSSAKSNLNKLDKIQNEALRRITGAHKSTPITSLEVEANIEPLAIRRSYLIAKTYVKLLNKRETNVTCTALAITSKSLSDENHPFNSYRSNAEKVLKILDLHTYKRMPQPEIMPPWIDIQKYIDRDVGLYNTSEIEMNQVFCDVLNQEYAEWMYIYCDGSKIETQSEMSTAAGIFISNENKAVSYKLNPAHTVVGAELFAIKMALMYIESNIENKNTIIFTDSMTATYLISNKRTDCYNILASEIRNILLRVNINKMVKIKWIKAHYGIRGNEIADRTAKMGHKNDRSVLFNLAAEEYLSLIRHNVADYFYRHWKFKIDIMGKGKYLADIRNSVGYCSWLERNHRKEEVLLTRLRTGLIGTNAYLYRFGQSNSELCDTCTDCVETTHHILFQCGAYTAQREIMMKTLSDIGVENVTLKILLGGGDYPRKIQKQIIDRLCLFLKSTKLIERFIYNNNTRK